MQIYLIFCLNLILLISCMVMVKKNKFWMKGFHFRVLMHSQNKVLAYVDRRYMKQLDMRRFLSTHDFVALYLMWQVAAVLAVGMSQNAILVKAFMCVILVGSPVLFLELLCKKMDISIDHGIFNLLTQLNANLMKSEDILQALDEVTQTLSNKHIQKIVMAFNQTIHMGGSPALAFETIKSAIDNEYLKYIFINIEIVYTRRGNVLELMRSLENEYTSIQVEINRRKVTLEQEKNMTVLSIFMVSLIALKVVKDNSYIFQFYQSHVILGMILLSFVLGGVALMFKASVQKY